MSGDKAGVTGVRTPQDLPPNGVFFSLELNPESIRGL